MVHAYLPPFPPFFAFLLPSPLLPPSLLSPHLLSFLLSFPSLSMTTSFFLCWCKVSPPGVPSAVLWSLWLCVLSIRVTGMPTFGYLVSAEHGRFPHGSSPWKGNTEQQESVWGKACSSHCLAARRQDYKPTLTLERSLENLVLRISHLRNKKLCEMTLETS